MLAAASVTETPAQQNAVQQSSIHVKTKDGSSFTVPFACLNDSALIFKWYTDLDLMEKKATPTFNVPHVTPYILEMILEFQEYHADEPAFDEKAFKPEDIDEHVKNLANDDLLQLTMGADILQLARLTRHCAECMASRMENKNSEEIKAMFDVDQLQEVDDAEMGEDEEEESKEDTDVEKKAEESK